MVSTRSLTRCRNSPKRRGRSQEFKQSLKRRFSKSFNANFKYSTATNSTKTILTRSKVGRRKTNMTSISTRSKMNRRKIHVTTIMTRSKMNNRKIQLKRTNKEGNLKVKKSDLVKDRKEASQLIDRSNRQSIAFRRKMLTRSHQNKQVKSKTVISSSLDGELPENLVVDAVNSAEGNNATISDEVEERADEMEDNGEEFVGTALYEHYLNLRSRGNSVIQKFVREIDHVEMVHISEVFQSVTRSWKANVTPELIHAYKVLTCNEQIVQKELECQLSHLSITTKPVANLLETSYVRLKDELWDDLRNKTNRLRPRDKKVNYNVLNGSKKSQNLRLKPPVEPKPTVMESTDEPMDVEIVSFGIEEKPDVEAMAVGAEESDCHCGKCDQCIADDAETDGCEMSDFDDDLITTTENAAEDLKVSPSSNAASANENETKVSPSSNAASANENETKGKKVSPRNRSNQKRKNRAPPRTSIERFSSSGSDCSDIEIDYPPSPGGLEVAALEVCAGDDETVNEQILDVSHGAIDDGNTSALVIADTTGDEGCVRRCQEDSKPQPPSQTSPETSDVSGLKTALKECIERIIKDKSKLKIKDDPIIAELTEIDYEYFYHLVLVLQGTDFVVKSAAMQNVKGPDDKIRQLYNCVICLKDETDKAGKDARDAEAKERDVSDEIGRDSSESCSPDSYKDGATNFRRFRTKIAPKTHPYIVPGKARLVSGKMKQKMNSKMKGILPKSTQLSISPVSMNKTANNQTTKDNKDGKGGCGRVVVKATCVKLKPRSERTYSDCENHENLELDPDLKDRIISYNSGKLLPDSRGLREALRRMGRRKTDPDIHPVCRRLNRKPSRKFQMGIESKPFLKRSPSESVAVSEVGVVLTSKSHADLASEAIPAVVSSAVHTNTVSSRGGKFVHRNELRNFGSPLKVELDNRGRFVDPYKPLERHQETPATALTASELLKLQKIDGSKPAAPAEPFVERKVKVAEDSDFELGDMDEITRLLKVAQSLPTEALKESRSDRKVNIMQLFPNGSCVPLQTIQLKNDAVAQSPSLTAKPLINKFGFRKILPRPNSECVAEDVNSKALFQDKTSKASRLQAVSVVTVSSVDSQSIGNIERCSVTEQNSQPPISPVKRHKRDMSFLKSLLRNKTPMANQSISIAGSMEHRELSPMSFGNSGSEFSPVQRPGFHFQRVHRTNLNDSPMRSLRVPPASFYTSVPVNNQTLSNPVPLKPITVCMTRRTDEGTYHEKSRMMYSNQK